MTKTMARVLALICAVGTLFLVFQVRFLKGAQGDRQVIFSVPGQTSVGEKTEKTLQKQLEEKYGEPRENVEIGTMTHLGQPVCVRESRTYGFDFLGQSFGGERYLFCTAETVRTADTEEPITAEHLVTYMARQASKEAEPEILWDTVQESYKESRESFDSLAG